MARALISGQLDDLGMAIVGCNLGIRSVADEQMQLLVLVGAVTMMKFRAFTHKVGTAKRWGWILLYEAAQLAGGQRVIAESSGRGGYRTKIECDTDMKLVRGKNDWPIEWMPNGDTQ